MEHPLKFPIRMAEKKKENVRFWTNTIQKSAVMSITFVNLQNVWKRSKEYSKSIEKYLTLRDKYITIVFCELSGDKLVTKGTYAKMARGEMVRFMAENSIENPEDIKKFDRLGYAFRHDLSSDTEYIFERRIEITSY